MRLLSECPNSRISLATPALGAAKLYQGYYLISSTLLSWYMPKQTQPIIKTPTVLDIFSGAGGMSLGFQNAGCDILGGIDNNPHAVRTHNINIFLLFTKRIKFTIENSR